MAKKKQTINLLPQEEFAGSTTGRVLAWTLSTFRIIVIFTELVVMGAFLSRFWLDAQAADLNEEIGQKEAVIEASSEFENEFRKAQEKISIFTSLTSETVSPPEMLTTVSQYLPSDISLTSFSFIAGELRIKGVSPSERAVAQLIENLNASGEFGEIKLTQLDSLEDSTSLLIFGLNISLGTKG